MSVHIAFDDVVITDQQLLPDGMPGDLYTFRGGTHFVELDTLCEVSKSMFHVAQRKNMPAEGLPCEVGRCRSNPGSPRLIPGRCILTPGPPRVTALDFRAVHIDPRFIPG